MHQFVCTAFISVPIDAILLLFGIYLAIKVPNYLNWFFSLEFILFNKDVDKRTFGVSADNYFLSFYCLTTSQKFILNFVFLTEIEEL